MFSHSQVPVHSAARNSRVLLIDDGSDMGIGLLLLFRVWGQATYTSRDWDDGLAQARALEPQVVVVNLELCGYEGLEAARAIRLLPGVNGARVIVLRQGMAYVVDREPAAESDRLRLVRTADLKANVAV